MEKLKVNENLSYLVGEIIVLKNEKEIEVFKIIGSDHTDFILEKIQPIVIENDKEFRTLLRVV